MAISNVVHSPTCVWTCGSF